MEINSGDLDLTSYFDVFLITNGRSSFKYTLKALENQKNVKFNLYVIEDMKWLDACNTCLEYSNLPFYLRLDDDMILHPMAIQFFNYFVKTHIEDEGVFYAVELWEPWNNRLCNKVKMYNRKLTKKVGFKTDSRGKVDKLFKKKAQGKGYKIIGGKGKGSAIGIHAACSFDDNYRYSQLRGEINDPTFKIRYKEIINLDKVVKKIPLDKQLEMSDKDLAELNKQKNTFFGKFIRKNEEQ